MRTAFAEDLLKELRSTVCDQVLLHEARAAVDENHQLDNLLHSPEVSRRRMQRTHQIDGHASRYRDSVRLIGVEPSGAPTLTEALRAGGPIDAPAGGIAADSLAPRRVGEAVFPIAQQYVHDVLLVDDADIVRAQQQLWNAARIVAEPGGAAAFAALVSGAYRPRVNERVAVIISGGNTSAVRLESAPASVDVAVRTTHGGGGL